MEKIIAGLVQMDSGPDMNENMRRATQVQCRATSAAGFPALPNGTVSICTAAA